MIDIIFSIAALLITTSYLFRDILLLRVISILGAFIYVIGGFLAGLNEAGMKALIFFSVVNLSINLVQSIILLLERLPILLPDEVKVIYTKCFSSMTTREFNKIYKLGQIKTAVKGELLAEQHQAMSAILLILSGMVHIKKHNRFISALSPGFFIGEISFFTAKPANSTVVVSTPKFKYLVWDQAILHKLEKSNFPLYVKFRNILAVDMVKKIDIHSALLRQLSE